ncbi:MAG: insulinase family protein, partial [Pseudomonadales bacterium]
MSNDFRQVRERSIDALQLTAIEYEHQPTGAKHFHLKSDAAENVFLVALRTVPEDSTGVAHILEHTVLCGSERYPVRDPFFLMIRRSLNTFMNAFTGADYTAYPFASQNRKDYFNLMSVYLDAVFHSRLHPLDFAQEGHRLEFTEPGNPDSPLEYKGVVYNEMKGDMSSPLSRLYHGVQERLYPTSTYHFHSGGDPAAIPALTYQALRDFYKTHYHPSNATFMTYGNIPAEEQQEFISRQALNGFTSANSKAINVAPVTRYQAPKADDFTYPVDEDDLSDKTHIVIGWLLGRNTDLDMLLKCHLLSDALLDTSASPLRKALETTGLATAASPLCGFQEDYLETAFLCGVEGSEPENAEAVEQLVMDVLQDVAANGIPVEQVEAVLHQLELSQRELGGDGYPYGLQLILSCMPAAIHRGDPIGLLDLEATMEKLRSEVRDPAFIKQLVQELLLDNPHRVRVVMKPDRNMAKQSAADEQAALARIKASLTTPQSSEIVAQAAQLAERQAEEEDLSILPKVTRDDIPAERDWTAIHSQASPQ